MFPIVTLKDIAKQCGVSVSTVSRAFDKSSRISLPVRQKILSCASEMGYAPNLIARSLKSNRTMTVALIIPSIDNRFYIDVLKHLEIQLHRFGYRLLVSFIQPGITTERECLEMMLSAKVDAIILIPENSTDETYILNLEKQVHIIQLFSCPYANIDSVVMDDNSGAEIGTMHLLQHGHRRILLVGGENRRAGFWEAINREGVAHDQILTLADLASVAQIQDAIRTFQPTAVFSVGSSNEDVWTALKQMNISIPDDVSVIVYDNTQWVSLVGLTAVAHDLQQLADAVVAQLLKRLADDTSPTVHTTLKPYLMLRGSVKEI